MRVKEFSTWNAIVLDWVQTRECADRPRIEVRLGRVMKDMYQITNYLGKSWIDLQEEMFSCAKKYY